MISPLSRRRRIARLISRLGVVCSATMLGVTTWGSLTAGALPAGTAATPGMTAPASGTSSAPFALGLTAPNNVCPGDTATGNYRWTTFMVPSTVDPAVLTFNSTGPIKPAGVTFAQPLFSSTQSPQVNKATGISDGLITPIPSFSFSVFEAVPGSVPTGNYKIGFACTLSNETKRFWVTEISVVAAQSSFTWTTVPVDLNASSTTTTAVPATTTTVNSSTTTTIKSTTTTTTSVASTSTTTAGTATTSVGTSTTGANVFATGTTTNQFSSSGTTGGSTIADTGTSTGPIIFWAVLLLVFGRMVILVSRPLRVRESDQP